MLDDAPTVRFADIDAFELAQRLHGDGRVDLPQQPVAWCPPLEIHQGIVLADRYRVLDRCNAGWIAYDERLTRPVVIERLAGPGTPFERIRREAATDTRLSDAVVVGDAAFSIRTMTAF